MFIGSHFNLQRSNTYEKINRGRQNKLVRKQNAHVPQPKSKTHYLVRIDKIKLRRDDG